MPEFKWIANSDAKTMRLQIRPLDDGVITLEQLKVGYEQTFSDG